MTDGFVPGQTLAGNVRDVAATHLDAALVSAAGIATDPGPSIHAVRKRIKQLRGLLRLVRAGLGPAFAPLDDELRDIARNLAPLREAEVLVHSVALLTRESGMQSSDFKALTDWAATRHARKAGRTDFDGLAADTVARLGRLRSGTQGWPIDGDDALILTAGLTPAIRQCRRGLKAVLARRDIEALHDLRRQVKYHRAHCALLAATMPEAMAARLALADRIGDSLGTDHDLADLVNRIARGGKKIAPKKTRRRAIRLARATGKRLQKQAIADARLLFPSGTKQLGKQLAAAWRGGAKAAG